mgnify:CR=1 FL=1
MKLFDVYPLFDLEIVAGKGCYTYDTQGTLSLIHISEPTRP